MSSRSGSKLMLRLWLAFAKNRRCGCPPRAIHSLPSRAVNRNAGRSVTCNARRLCVWHTISNGPDGHFAHPARHIPYELPQDAPADLSNGGTRFVTDECSRCDLISRIQLVVLSFLLNQIIVRSALYDPSVLQHHDAIRISDRGQPVGDHKCSPSLHQGIHAF